MFSLSKTTSALVIILSLGGSLGVMAAADGPSDKTTASDEARTTTVGRPQTFDDLTPGERKSWDKYFERMDWYGFLNAYNRWSKEEDKASAREEILEGMPIDQVRDYLLGKRKTINPDDKYVPQSGPGFSFSADYDVQLAASRMDLYRSEINQLPTPPRVGEIWDYLKKDLGIRFKPFQVLLIYSDVILSYPGDSAKEKFWSFAWRQLRQEVEYFKRLEAQYPDRGWQALYEEFGRIIAISEHRLTEKELDRFIMLENSVLPQGKRLKTKEERQLKAWEHISKVVSYSLKGSNRAFDKNQRRDACRFTLTNLANIAK
ncbi:MAG: hypothetical protein J6Y94_05020 [Bacteriovoracaceae bacterium]|nr:hypothetical protein [Bacteriovoracaceae bacterium]